MVASVAEQQAHFFEAAHGLATLSKTSSGVFAGTFSGTSSDSAAHTISGGFTSARVKTN